MTAHDNMPTVVVVLVAVTGGLLMIRRGVADGYEELALPGGDQMRGESWQEAGAREVLEETGLRVAPEPLRLLSVVTTPDRRQNLLFCASRPAEFGGRAAHDREILEVLVVHGPVRTAFPTHDAVVAQFFTR